MAFDPRCKSPNRYGLVTTIKTTVLVAGIASLGLVAWGVAQATWPLMKASTDFALEGQMSNIQATAEATDVVSPVGMPVSAGRVSAVAALPVLRFGFSRAPYSRRAIRSDALDF